MSLRTASYKNKKAHLPINPVTALPRPQMLASPVRTNENRIGRHSVSSVKSIATVNQLLSDFLWALCIFVSMVAADDAHSRLPPPKRPVSATNILRAVQLGELAATMENTATPKMETCQRSIRPMMSASSPTKSAPMTRPAYIAADSSVGYCGANSIAACGVTRLIETSSILSCGREYQQTSSQRCCGIWPIRTWSTRNPNPQDAASDHWYLPMPMASMA